MDNDKFLEKKRDWKARKVTAQGIRQVRAAFKSIEPSPAVADGAVERALIIAVCAVLMFGLLMFKACTPARAEVPQDKAILAIIGEAENQGYKGMLAVAGAIRNRGTLKGVYGLKAPRVTAKKYTATTYAQAKKAWLESATNDVTKGATHWENIKAFGTPYWVKSCVKVFAHKDHVFYREVRRG